MRITYLLIDANYMVTRPEAVTPGALVSLLKVYVAMTQRPYFLFVVIPGVGEGAEWHLSLTPGVELQKRTRNFVVCSPFPSVTVAPASRRARTDGKPIMWL